MIQSILGWEPSTPFRARAGQNLCLDRAAIRGPQGGQADREGYDLSRGPICHSFIMSALTDIIGAIPYRMAFAGGWIDQPFISQLNPSPPGSMVVVGLEPTSASWNGPAWRPARARSPCDLWGGRLPEREPDRLVARALRRREPRPGGAFGFAGHDRADLSGRESPRLRRILARVGCFPAHRNLPSRTRYRAGLRKLFTCCQLPRGLMATIRWKPRTSTPIAFASLGMTGKECFGAIVARDARALGALDERLHGVLGSDLAMHRAAPGVDSRFERPSGVLPIAVSRCDVFRLRRRIFVRGGERAGARRVKVRVRRV